MASPPRSFTRRRVLIGAGVAGAAGVAVGTGLTAWPGTGRAGTTSFAHGHGRLVLITLYGGNDGLNTVVPVDDPAYHAARPNLAYRPDQVLPIGDGLALNPTLTHLHAAWSAKQLAIVRGVGYPNPSLSHFESMDIWQTANPGEGTGPGWLGRWLDATGTDPLRAVNVGASLPLALRGDTQAAAAVTGDTVHVPGGGAIAVAYANLVRPGSDRGALEQATATSGRDLLAVQKQLARARPAATPSAATTTTTTTTTTGALAGQLQVIADLIAAGLPTQVYGASLSSFDTHADERVDQERMLSALDAGLGPFLARMAAIPAGRDVVTVVYTEFGRRPAENASGGTDHGTAGPVLVVGPRVRGGFLGEQPSLTALDANGNLRHTVDFRSVYASVLGSVLGVDPKPFVGGTFPTLTLV